MKYFCSHLLLILFLFLFSNVYSQDIFKYEREISNKDRYVFNEIDFENLSENIKLSGTLITPKSDFKKIIIIVPGSGKDTRHSHPKLVELLLKNNIAVYRFDERGIGKSNGEHSEKLSTLIIDLNYCIIQLRTVESIKEKKIGVLGHSLGGLASVGILQYQPKIDFLIQMSTPIDAGQSFKSKVSEVEIFRNQKNSIDDIEKVIDTFNYIIHSTKEYSDIIKKCERVRKKLKLGEYISKAYLSPIIIDIVKESNELNYKNIKIPTLYIIDENDENIDVEYGISKLKEFNNKFISIDVLKGLDHYLSLNNARWKMYKESADREIDTSAAKKIINWATKI